MLGQLLSLLCEIAANFVFGPECEELSVSRSDPAYSWSRKTLTKGMLHHWEAHAAQCRMLPHPQVTPEVEARGFAVQERTFDQI